MSDFKFAVAIHSEIFAVSMASRLDFSIDAPIDAAIARHRGEIARSAPARLIEEFYKLLRAGSSETAFRMLAERRLLEPIAPELQKRGFDLLVGSVIVMCLFWGIGGFFVQLGHREKHA